MPRKPKAVPLSKVEDIQASLKQKAATPKSISLEDLIKSLAKPIQDMLDAGYDYSDVASVFKGHQVELAASSLKSFHKKASTTDDSSSNSSAIDSKVDEDSQLESTSSTTATSNDIPPVEPDSSPTESGEPSDSSPSQTTKRKKTTPKTSSQFNVTDRSEL
ncbi:hypothetical protein VB735_32570 [Halotia wernerae UHCC 0503]|nr:hypothetical protein [Halotia wernerae UHCC 0503]